MGTFTVHQQPDIEAAYRLAASLILGALSKIVVIDDGHLKHQPIFALDNKLNIEDLTTAFIAHTPENDVLHHTLFVPTHDQLSCDFITESLESRFILPLARASLTYMQKLVPLPQLFAESSKSQIGLRSPDVFLGKITSGLYFNGAKDPGTFAGLSNGFEGFNSRNGSLVTYGNYGPTYEPERAWSKRGVTQASLVVGMITTKADAAVIAEIHDPDHPLHYLTKSKIVEIIVTV